MHDGKAVFHSQEWTFIEAIGQPGNEDGCECDEGIDENGRKAIGHLKSQTAIESREQED